jgi:sugar phosphate isomerase/epimerase
MKINNQTIGYARRDFLKINLSASIGLVLGNLEMFTHERNPRFQPLIGICAPYTQGDMLKGFGYDYIEESVGRFLIPDNGDDIYIKNRELYLKLKFPVRSYTSFFPRTLKSVGPDIHHEAILQRAELALRRAAECGSVNIVFGSGGSREIPDGFDRAVAKEQHISLSKKLAMLAGKYKVTVSIEPLNRSETNFVNSLSEGAEIVEIVNHPRFRMVCDIYHMLKDNESPDEIIRFGKHIEHCHIAEKEGRTAPGIKGDDFRPYLRALKTIGYRGGISLECNWKDFDTEASAGVAALRKQIAQV